jgi:outer membrane protein assembly factor BamB
MSTIPPRRPLPGLDCAAMSKLLPLLHSPELDADEAQRVQRHVEMCEWCRQIVATYDVVDDALRYHYSGPTAPFLSMEDVMNGSHDDDTSPSWIVEPITQSPAYHRRAPGRITTIAAVAAVLLIIIFAGAVFGERAGLLGTHMGGAPTSTTHATAPVASPTVAPATHSDIYFGTNGAQSGLTALHSSDGTVAWQITGPAFQVAPVLSHGIVYAISTDDMLYAMRAPAHGTTGDVLWHVSVRQGAALLLTDGNALYIATPKLANVSSDAHGFIDAYSFGGQQLWSYGYDAGDFSSSCVMSTSPGTMIVANGILYASGNCAPSMIEAVRVSDRSKTWVERSPLPPGSPLSSGIGLTVANGVLYENHVSNGTAWLCARDANSGQQHWCRQLPSQESMGTTAPVVQSGMVVVATDLDLYGLSPSDGSQRWTQHVGRLLGQPTTAGGIVYVAGSDRVVHAYRDGDGHQLWQYTMTGNGSDPVVANGAVYLHSYADGTGFVFTVLDATNGLVIRKQTIAATSTTSLIVG